MMSFFDFFDFLVFFFEGVWFEWLVLQQVRVAVAGWQYHCVA
jgi:hypothetical protein